MKNDFYVYRDGELYHHGIRGQKWGEQNGPPYPLDKSDHSAAERKFDTGKTSSESRSEKTGSGENKTWTGQYGNAYDKTISDEEAQNFWKSYAKSLQSEQSDKSSVYSGIWEKVGKTHADNPFIPEGVQVIDPYEFAYEMATRSLTANGKTVSDNSEEFKKEFERQYKLEMSIADFNAKQLNKGKGFFSRHSKRKG